LLMQHALDVLVSETPRPYGVSDSNLLGNFLRFGLTGWFNYPQLTQGEYEEYTRIELSNMPQHVKVLTLVVPIYVTRISLYNLASYNPLWGLGFFFLVAALVATAVNFYILYLLFGALHSSVRWLCSLPLCLSTSLSLCLYLSVSGN